jgi:hypothetical protein
VPKPQPKKQGGEEFFYVDADGKKRDAELHNAILDDGDHDAAKAISDKIRARILGKREQQKQWAAAKLRALALLKDYDESKHPRDEHGRWTDSGGGDDTLADAPDKVLLIGTGTNLDRLKEWIEKIEAQQAKLEAGGEQESKLQRLKVPLQMYLNASETDRKAGYSTLYEIHDGDSNLLASVFSQFNPETRVTHIEGLGGLQHEALVKALKFTVRHAQEDNHSQRIEKTEFSDEKDAIAALEAAGFKQTGTGVGGVTRLVIGDETTEAEKARLERLKGEHSQKIFGASKATAQLLDYDPNKVSVNDGDHAFTIGGETTVRHAAGLAHLATGEIEIFPEQLMSVKATVSVMAHEIGHQKYQTVLNAVDAERKLVMNDPDTVALEGLSEGMRPDGSLPPDLAKKYPLYSLFVKHDNNLDKRIKSDGVTAYSKSYWEQAKPGTPNQVSLHLAQHETIAEMAMLVTDKGEKRAMADAAPVWRSYYRDIMKTYAELKEGKYAATGWTAQDDKDRT